MQEEPPEARGPEPPVEGPVAVLRVARHRMAERRAVHADLMGAAGAEEDLRERHPVARRDRRELGHRCTPRFGDPHHPLASGPTIAIERKVHPATPAATEAPAEERDIPLVEGSPAQSFMQRPQGAAALGDHEAPRGLPVEPVRELEIPGSRAGGSQQLDHPVRDPAPAVHGDAGGLVQHEQPIVLEHDCAFDPPDLDRRRSPARLRLPEGNDGGDPDRFSRPQAASRPRPRAVHAHLAPPKEPMQPVTGDVRQLGMQEVVDPAAVVLAVNRHVPGRAPLGGRRRYGR